VHASGVRLQHFDDQPLDRIEGATDHYKDFCAQMALIGSLYHIRRGPNNLNTSFLAKAQ
jgi:hypothetical protein